PSRDAEYTGQEVNIQCSRAENAPPGFYSAFGTGSRLAFRPRGGAVRGAALLLGLLLGKAQGAQLRDLGRGLRALLFLLFPVERVALAARGEMVLRIALGNVLACVRWVGHCVSLLRRRSTQD